MARKTSTYLDKIRKSDEKILDYEHLISDLNKIIKLSKVPLDKKLIKNAFVITELLDEIRFFLECTDKESFGVVRNHINPNKVAGILNIVKPNFDVYDALEYIQSNINLLQNQQHVKDEFHQLTNLLQDLNKDFHKYYDKYLLDYMRMKQKLESSNQIKNLKTLDKKFAEITKIFIHHSKLFDEFTDILQKMDIKITNLRSIDFCVEKYYDMLPDSFNIMRLKKNVTFEELVKSYEDSMESVDLYNT